MEQQALSMSPPLETMTLEVANPNLDGMALGTVPGLADMGVAVSRAMHAGEVRAATPETVLRLGMLLHAVGRPDALEKLRVLAGVRSETNLPQVPGPLEIRRFVVSRRKVLGKSVPELAKALVLISRAPALMVVLPV